MPDVLVRDLETPVLTQLKKRAKKNHRSLQAELKLILIEAAEPDEVSFDEAVRFADEMRRKYAGKITGDSTDIIREARDR
jgi:plasmid stability protein